MKKTDNKSTTNINTSSKKSTTKEKKLSPKEEAFCIKYVELGNSTQAVYEAGYKCKDDNTASTIGYRLLRRDKVVNRIKQLTASKHKDSIATGQEVMEYLTRVMRGEEKDQFGLDAPLSERTKAGLEIAKRTVDIDNRAKGNADSVVQIKLDWKR